MSNPLDETPILNQYHYLPRFHKFIIPKNTPTNPLQYPIIDCSLALKQTSEYFPILQQGFTKQQLKSYYYPFLDPISLLKQYYQQCTTYKTYFETQLSLGKDLNELLSVEIDESTPQRIHDQSQSTPKPYFIPPPIDTSSSIQYKLPHEAGIWELHDNTNGKKLIQAFPNAIQHEEYLKLQGFPP